MFPLSVEISIDPPGDRAERTIGYPLVPSPKILTESVDEIVIAVTELISVLLPELIDTESPVTTALAPVATRLVHVCPPAPSQGTGCASPTLESRQIRRNIPVILCLLVKIILENNNIFQYCFTSYVSSSDGSALGARPRSFRALSLPSAIRDSVGQTPRSHGSARSRCRRIPRTDASGTS